HLTLPTPYGSWTGADGSFRMEGLMPGRFHFAVHHPDYIPLESSLEIAATEEPAPMEIALRGAGKLEGHIDNLAKRSSMWSAILLRNLDEPGKKDLRFPVNAWKEDYSLEGVAPGHYEAILFEQVVGPNTSPDATAFKVEDMVERTLPLGEVEIRVGETARFDTTVPPVPKASK